VRNGEILTSHATNCLVGVNRSFVFELGQRLGIPVRETNLTHYDLITADEAFFTGNTLCLLPVQSVNGVAMRDGAPGPVSERLTRAWIEDAGCDWRGKAIGVLNRA
jgi:branched-chain amino acid aminotransferase